ncbi:MAG: LamG domain-containing protein, partial [Candidatus Poribacteria bacterium]|nr:LamG domain-containing protein [Candidatus Poribacteria bacterium]
GSPSFTIEFWARPEIQATEGWVGKGAGSASRAIRVRADPASWVLHFWDNDWNPNPVVPVVLGEWQHVVFTFDGTSNIGQAYTDGVFQGQHTFAAVDFASSPFWIGQEVWAGAASAMGRIDEMRVYDRVLIDAEITQNLGVQTNSLSVEPSGKLGVVWATLKRF